MLSEVGKYCFVQCPHSKIRLMAFSCFYQIFWGQLQIMEPLCITVVGTQGCGHMNSCCRSTELKLCILIAACVFTQSLYKEINHNETTSGWLWRWKAVAQELFHSKYNHVFSTVGCLCICSEGENHSPPEIMPSFVRLWEGKHSSRLQVFYS